jgi:chromosome segregation ATPase
MPAHAFAYRLTRPALGLALALAASAAGAESAKPGADAGLAQSLRKAQGMLRQLAQEKADLEAKAQSLEGQVKTLETQIAPLQNQLQQTQASLYALQGQKTALERDKASLARDKTALEAQAEQLREGIQTQKDYIEEQRGQLQAAAEQLQATGGDLEKTRADNQLLVNAVKERSRWIQECTGKNRSLFKANKELLDKFADEGLWDRIKTAEPFTGIGKVAKENAVQDFAFKLEDLQVTPWEDSPAAAAPLPQAAEAQP